MFDDVFSLPVAIGFPFTFYGNTYDSLLVSSNSLVSFELNKAGQISPFLPAFALPVAPNSMADTSNFNSILGPWYDLNPSVSKQVTYGISGLAPNRIFYVNYNDVPLFFCTAIHYSGQIQLHEGSNVIETYIYEREPCTTWQGGRSIHGVVNEDGTLADIVPGRNYPTYWTAQHDGQRFTPNGSNAYTIAAIPFQPLTPAGAVAWYDINGNFIALSDTLTVAPAVTTQYIARANLCDTTAFMSDTVTVSTACGQGCFPPYVNVLTTDVCPNECNGTVVVAPVGASSPWLLHVEDDSSDTIYNGITNGAEMLTGLCAGTYTVESIDALGCTKISSFTLTTPPVITAQTSSTSATCTEICDGSFVITSSGGAGFYNYSLDSGLNVQSDPLFDSLCVGNHVLQVTDLLGCALYQNQLIGADSNFTFTGTTVVASTVNDDGAIDLTVSGNNDPFQYLWNTGDTTMSIDSLAPGTYWIEVTDSIGCILSDTFLVDLIAHAAFDQSQSGICLFPNPTTDLFVMDLKDYPVQGEFSVTVMAVDGRLLFSEQYAGSEQQISVSTSEWPAGAYEVLLQWADQRQLSRKVMVVR